MRFKIKVIFRFLRSHFLGNLGQENVQSRKERALQHDKSDFAWSFYNPDDLGNKGRHFPKLITKLHEFLVLKLISAARILDLKKPNCLNYLTPSEAEGRRGIS